MTRKDYIAIAKELNHFYPAIERDEDMNLENVAFRDGYNTAIGAVMQALQADNPNFNAKTFEAAVRGDI